MFMRRLCTLIATLFLLPLTLWSADAPAALKSGPEVGKDLPGPFHPYNVTGKEAGNFHCVVCTGDGDSLVLVFVRNTELSPNLQDLLKTLEAAVAKDAKARITAAAIFLFDDLKNVVTDDVNRKKYADKVEALKAPNKLENVIVCLDSADAPKNYGLNTDAKATVLVCSKLRVVANFAFDAETKIDGKAIVAAVTEKLGSSAKK